MTGVSDEPILDRSLPSLSVYEAKYELAVLPYATQRMALTPNGTKSVFCLRHLSARSLDWLHFVHEMVGMSNEGKYGAKMFKNDIKPFVLERTVLGGDTDFGSGDRNGQTHLTCLVGPL